jgi:hypothetical protein
MVSIKNIITKIYFVVVLFTLAPFLLFSATYQIGPGKAYSKISNVTNLVGPGDTVEIYDSTYNEANIWNNSGTFSSPILIKGVGSIKPIIDGTGINLSSEPDSLFMIKGSNYIIENLEFKNGGVNDGGSAIRVFGSNVIIRNCKISYCAIGISSSTTAANTLVEYTEISDCIDLRPTNWGHNVYMNSDSIFRYCYIHDSGKGHNFKTRGHYTELLYNYIADANSAEIDAVDAGIGSLSPTNTANSNLVAIGNVIKKRNAPPKSGYTGNDVDFIVFGEDTGGTGRNGTLYLINNTIIAGMSQNKVIQLTSTNSKAVLYNNIIYGTNQIVGDSTTDSKTTGGYNWLPQLANIPSKLSNTLQGIEPGFVSTTNNDYHLNSASTCINAGYSNPIYIDGSGVSHTGVPEYEYVHSLSFVTRARDGQLDIGAYEYGTVIPISGGGSDPFVNTKVYPNPFRISESFNKGVKIIDIPMNSRIEIYNISGDRIRILNSNFSYGVIWDGKDDKGEYVPFGVYNYVIFDTLGNKKKGKITLIK